MVEQGLRSARADAGTAVFLAAGAARSAARAIAANLDGEPAGSEFAVMIDLAARRLAEAEEAERRARRLLEEPPAAVSP
jgi:hypothetical protein